MVPSKNRGKETSGASRSACAQDGAPEVETRINCPGEELKLNDITESDLRTFRRGAAAGHDDRQLSEQGVSISVTSLDQGIEALLQQVEILAAQGCFQEAQQLCKRLLASCTHHRLTHLKARTLRQLGNLYFSQGKNRLAARYYRRCYKLALASGEPGQAAYALNNLTAIYFRQAAWNRMQDAGFRAFDLAQALDNDQLAACIAYNLGAMYSLQGETRKALLILHQSITYFEKAHDLTGLAETYNNLGNAYRDLGMFREAARAYGHSLHFARLAERPIIYACVLTNRAELSCKVNDYTLALRHSQEALKIFREYAYETGEADVIKCLGTIAMHQKEFSQAESHFQRAIEINLRNQHIFGLVETYLAFAELEHLRQRKQKALDYAQEARRHYRALGATSRVEKLDAWIAGLER